jgi:hypothetical protein
MKIRKSIWVGVIVIGLVLVGLSFYIQNEVANGRMQVRSAESSLQRGKALFSLSPATNQVGDAIQRSADRKLGEANQEIAYYANLAQILLVGGVIVAIGGAIFLIRSWRR